MISFYYFLQSFSFFFHFSQYYLTFSLNIKVDFSVRCVTGLCQILVRRMKGISEISEDSETFEKTKSLTNETNEVGGSF